jgi:HlyD family secretion protein
VIKKTVEAGQTVAASLQAPELFVIAEDLTDMQVETSIDESDIGRVRVGQKATFTVDSYPNRTFEGAVRQIRLAAQNTANVITYIVIVSAPNPRKELFPGMTANVRIILDTRENVKLVPNAAIRFRPPSTETIFKSTPSPGANANARSQAFLDRLITDLVLSEEQRTRAEGIVTTMRNKMAVAHQAPEAERKRQIDSARAEMREMMMSILDEDQKTKFEVITAEFDDRRASSTTGRIFVLSAGKPTEVQVRLGLSDGSMTELMSSEPPAGTLVITGTGSSRDAGSSRPVQPPGPRLF